MNTTTWIIVLIVVAIVVALISAFIATQVRKNVVEKKIGSAEGKAREIIDEAIKSAEAKKKEALLEAKEENLKAKNELDKEIKERRAEVQRYEKRVLNKEEAIERKSESLEKKENGLKNKEEKLAEAQTKVDELSEKRVQELERISGLTSEQAKEYLLKTVEEEVKIETAKLEVARIALEKLIVDGRIHPARIEEMVEKAQRDVESMIREEGEAATLEVGVHGIHPELVKLLGKMKFRTSYGQNALKHSIEVAHLSGLLAAEMGLDVRIAKRAGLLHDIGKAVDHEMEGTHIQLGVDLCRKYKESAVVINAVEAHHGDVEPENLIACIVQAADAISAARPGARRETLETYTNRLKQLEDITNSFEGVDKSFAIQAGREIRVMVIPEKVTDADMVLMARDISKQIEAELEYPGQIKVNVVRESRAIDYAK